MLGLALLAARHGGLAAAERAAHIGSAGLRRKEAPEKISSSMSFDIQNKLEIIQRWRREDELWDSSHGFFFFFLCEEKKEREREREREGKREEERERDEKNGKSPPEPQVQVRT